VVYYDAYESPDAMRGVEEEEEEEEEEGSVGGGTGGRAPAGPLSDEQLAALQYKTRQLEARRGRITSKRAYLKNKKVRPRPCRPPPPITVQDARV